MRGDLRQTSLPVLLRHLYAERKSGTLHLSAGGRRRRLHFSKGAMVFADAGEDLSAGARESAEALLFSLFSWTSGEFSFEDGEPLIDDALAFTRPPWELILEGSRTVEDPRILERYLGTAGTLFACSETTELPLFRVKLAPAESAVLAHGRARDRFSSRELSHAGSELSVKRALNTLVSLGLLQIVHMEEASESEPDPTREPDIQIIEAEPAPEPDVQSAGEPETTPQPEIQLAAEPEPAAVSPLSFDAVPSELEELLDSFPSRRPLSVPSTSTTPRAPFAPPPPESVEKPAEVEPPQPAAPLPAEPLPVEVPVATIPSPAPAPARAIPQGTSRLPLFAAAGAVVLIATLAVLLWPSAEQEERPETQPVVAAAQPPPPEPEPPAEEASSGPSEAELFYQANLAVERGDLERARKELAKLLARRPDFTAARELMARVDRELLLRALPPPPAPKTPPPAPRVAETERQRAAPAPKKPDPAALFADAERALARGELDTAESKLAELRALAPAHEGAEKLREEIAVQRWTRTLPLSYPARHSHRLGGCSGVVSLEANGIGYRSKEHEWLWSFSELARTERRDERRLSLETRAKKSFNFELEEPLPERDWTRFLALRAR